MTFLTIILLYLAACSKAVQDAIAHGKWYLFGDWWDPVNSWKNKYKNGDPQDGPLFWGSTTVFVWMTDGWHFFQMLQFSFWQLAFALHFHYLSALLERYMALCSKHPNTLSNTVYDALAWFLALISPYWISVIVNFFFIKYVYGATFELIYKQIEQIKASKKDLDNYINSDD